MLSARLLVIASVVLFCCLGPQNLRAEKTHFVIGVEDLEYYPLWRYDRVEKKYAGLGRKLLDSFARNRGYTFEYRALPIKRLVRELVEKKIDFKFPDNSHWAKEVKRDVSITYSNSAIKYTDGVFVRPENKGKGNQSIKVLGSVLGFTPWDWLERIEKKDVSLKETRTFDALVQQVISGRVDGAYANTSVVEYHLKELGLEDALVFDKELSHINGEYLLSTALHPSVIAEFNSWLVESEAQVASIKKEFGVK